MFLATENIGSQSGYSKAVRELFLALSKYMEVGIIDQQGKIPERFWSLLKGSFDPSRTVVFERVYFGDPFKFSGFKGVIGNLVLESTKLPERAIRDANDDRIVQIWVPSKHCFNNYANCGIVENKMRIISHGVDITKYTPSTRKLKNDKFRFLFVGGYLGKGDRKGADILVQAFKEEFKSKEKVELYLKINTAYGQPPVQDLQGNNIIVDTNTYTDEQMVKLYQSSNCYVLPTRGEGFSQDGLEAIACGLPLITTAWGGQLDYCIPSREGSCISVDYDLKPAKYSAWDCGMWAEPNLEDLKGAMRYRFEHPIKPKYDLSNWTWDKSALLACKAFNEIFPDLFQK